MNFLMLQTDQWRWKRLYSWVNMCQHALKEKRKERHQCIVGALPTTHFNAHQLCLGIHVRNCLHGSRGSLEAGCGSWNWINFKTSPHMVTASLLRAVGQFRTPHGPWPRFKRPHTFLSTSSDHILSSTFREYFCVPLTRMELCTGCEIRQSVPEELTT